MAALAETQPNPEPGAGAVDLLYPEVCKSHTGIADFRARLLALLPLASGICAGPPPAPAGDINVAITCRMSRVRRLRAGAPQPMRQARC
jgi:hypothetical protein